MSSLNRFRWISSVLALTFTLLGAIGTIFHLYVLEAEVKSNRQLTASDFPGAAFILHRFYLSFISILWFLLQFDFIMLLVEIW